MYMNKKNLVKDNGRRSWSLIPSILGQDDNDDEYIEWKKNENSFFNMIILSKASE